MVSSLPLPAAAPQGHPRWQEVRRGLVLSEEALLKLRSRDA